RNPIPKEILKEIKNIIQSYFEVL
ncbi:MAG: hypothetical protein UV07_C0008G0001, partial [Candidatus Azambacteria bacterium GW2011_GWB1_42_17]